MHGRLPVTVVLTGATSGIGRATALVLAEHGASLTLAARDSHALSHIAHECRRLGAEATPCVTDVTDYEAVQKLAKTAIEQYGRIDVWINMVGTGAVGRLESIPIKAHRKVIESTLLGHLYGAHAVMPHFRQRRQGILINMVSIGGWVPAPYAASYSASKFGLRGLSEALRAEVSNEPNIHICEVYPALVNTAGLSHTANYTGKRLRPPPPLLDPYRVAEHIVELIQAPRPYVSIGSLAWPARIAHAVAPNLTLRITRRLTDMALKRADPIRETEGNLYHPTQDPRVRGGYNTENRRSMKIPLALAMGVGVAGIWFVRHLTSRH